MASKIRMTMREFMLMYPDLYPNPDSISQTTGQPSGTTQETSSDTKQEKETADNTSTPSEVMTFRFVNRRDREE